MAHRSSFQVATISPVFVTVRAQKVPPRQHYSQHVLGTALTAVDVGQPGSTPSRAPTPYCTPQILFEPSRWSHRLCFEAIFVMQPAQDGRRDDSIITSAGCSRGRPWRICAPASDERWAMTGTREDEGVRCSARQTTCILRSRGVDSRLRFLCHSLTRSECLAVAHRGDLMFWRAVRSLRPS
jgi:hypothetical protein